MLVEVSCSMCVFVCMFVKEIYCFTQLSVIYVGGLACQYRYIALFAVSMSPSSATEVKKGSLLHKSTYKETIKV